MLRVLKFDNYGNFIGLDFISPNANNEYDIPENCTEKELPQPNYKPRFDSELNEWVETKPMPTEGFIKPMWDGVDWVETPVSPVDDITLLKESDAFAMLQLIETQQQLEEANSNLEASQQTITDLQTQLSQERQTNADLTLQLVMKGVL
jgi:hypothetical protein